jgi:hypothetical protein
MKTFESLNFDLVQCRREVAALQKWLGRRRQVMPYFQEPAGCI